jgi:transglutaminase-like putative cysteine protease
MLLSIRHTSRYLYDQSVPYAVQRLRLRPQSIAGQTVRDWDVEISGATPEVSYTDGFGNRTDLVRHERGAQEIVITASGQVETEDRVGVFGSVYGFAPIWLFERQTELTKPGSAISGLAASLPKDADRLELLHQLMDVLNEKIAYRPGTTLTSTTGEDALERGEGVCQDHTHAFISVARLLNIPARYISGYLMMDGVANQAAGHAWAEAHVEGLGWVGFDAANNVCPNDHYVRLACGLDYREAAPISGVRFGEASESLAVALQVEQ